MQLPLISRSANPDPLALGKYQHYTNRFLITSWLCLFFTTAIFLDSYLIEKLDNETVLKLEEKVELVNAGKYSNPKPRSYFTLKTENLDMRLSVYEATSLDLKISNNFSYWRTSIFHQKLQMIANDKRLSYYTLADGYFKLLLIQGIAAFIGLLGFIPGQVRIMAIIISGLCSLFSLLGLL
jgi:hypothetical protein